MANDSPWAWPVLYGCCQHSHFKTTFWLLRPFQVVLSHHYIATQRTISIWTFKQFKYFFYITWNRLGDWVADSAETVAASKVLFMLIGCCTCPECRDRYLGVSEAQHLLLPCAMLYTPAFGNICTLPIQLAGWLASLLYFQDKARSEWVDCHQLSLQRVLLLR